jgi:hypothetical protein
VAAAEGQTDSTQPEVMPEPPPFHVEYDSAVAYNLGLRSTPRSILNKDSTLHKSTVLPGHRINEKQIIRIIDILNDNSTYGDEPYACFEPKHAVVFYHKGRISGLIQVCFGCNNLVSTPEFPAMKYHYRKAKMEYLNYGFSKKGVKKLKKYFESVGLKVSS